MAKFATRVVFSHVLFKALVKTCTPHASESIAYSSTLGMWYVNIFTCILLCMHSSCTPSKIMSFVRGLCENTSTIVNLAVGSTVCKYFITYNIAQFKLDCTRMSHNYTTQHIFVLHAYLFACAQKIDDILH